MKVEQVVCNECKPPRVKGEANHWLEMGVLTMENGSVQITLGVVPKKAMPGYEVHDICGCQCFHRHIDRLLGRVVDVEPPPIPAAAASNNAAGYTGV